MRAGEDHRRHGPLRHARSDEGPIIEQAVSRVSHHHTPKDFVEMGRDLNARCWRAVRWHLERRVIISAGKTVVFA